MYTQVYEKRKKKQEALGFGSLFSHRKMTHLEKRGNFIDVRFYWKLSLYMSTTEGLP